MKKGKLFVIEGIDGCGKSSIAKRLEKEFSVGCVGGLHATFEPGGSDFGIKMRKLILDSGSRIENAKTLFLAFWSSRSSHIDQIIIPKINEGINVVCDRMDGSTFAFQLYGQENRGLEPLFWLLRDYIMCEIDPYYIYLDLSVETSAKRILKREKDKKEQCNHFDLRPADFHRRIKEGYGRFFQDSRLFGKFKIIDAERPIDDVYNDVSRYIKGII